MATHETEPSRLDELKSLVAQFPSDPFPLYGLAMEHRSLGDVAAARATFEQLLARFPDYVPQYLMYGQLLAGAAADKEAARRILGTGIEKARAARNNHALGELQSALGSLDDASDDD